MGTLFDARASATPFIEALEKFHRPVVIDWGLPAGTSPRGQKLFDGGVMLWWFAPDWNIARRKFIDRSGKGPVEVLDIQIRKIEAALPEINALFGSRKEYALPSTGIYPSPDKLWKSILDTLVEPARRATRRTPPRPSPSSDL